MPSTSPWAIPYPDGPTNLTALQTHFANIANAVNTALTTGLGGAPRIANSDAERLSIFPAPIQGNTVMRPDKGWLEQYFGTYNASTNPGGASPAGWYPTAPNGPHFYGVKTVDQSIPNNAVALLTWDVKESVGMSESAGAVTVTTPGWYRVTANLGGFANTAGNNRWLTVTKNTTSNAPRFISVITTTNIGADDIWNATKVINFAANDVIRCQALQDSGAALLLNLSQFSIEWMGPIRG